MIKLIVNDVELDLKSDTVVALTKKAVDIGNLQNRWSSYTNKFTVPATKKNRDALGIKQFQDASGSQYQYQNGKLVSGGLEIASNVLVIIESVSKDITLTLRAGNGGLFDQLNRTKLSDLDWDDLNHTWQEGSIIGNRDRDYTHGYVYPLHQTGVQSNTKNTVVPKGMLPFIYVKSAFERIASFFGYTWTGDTYTLTAFEKLTYPVATLKVTHPFTSAFTFWANFQNKTISQNVPTPSYLPNYEYFVQQTLISDPKNCKTDFNANYLGGPRFGAAMFYTGVYRCEVNYSITYKKYAATPLANTQAYIGIGYDNYLTANKKFVKRINLPTPTTVSQTATGTFTFDFTLDAINYTKADNYIIGFRVGHQNCEEFTINSGYFKITDVLGEEAGFNREIDFNGMQPDISLGKYIKEVGNIFGAIYDVDEFKKTIEITRLDEIALNKAYALDWTDKLDLGEQIITTFKMDGLAKSMVMQWKDDLNYTKVITIDNEQLPERDEYIKSDADYSLEAKCCLYPDSVSLIPTWDLNSQVMKMDDKLRFASIYDNTTETLIYPLGTLTSVQTNFKVAYFYNDQYANTLDWSNLYNNYYADLLDPMTDRLQVVECFMKLNDLDIQSFRFKYPVYIKHFNRYFFVNEIAEYTGKTQSTKVLLVGI